MVRGGTSLPDSWAVAAVWDSGRSLDKRGFGGRSETLGLDSPRRSIDNDWSPRGDSPGLVDDRIDLGSVAAVEADSADADATISRRRCSSLEEDGRTLLHQETQKRLKKTNEGRRTVSTL